MFDDIITIDNVDYILYEKTDSILFCRKRQRSLYGAIDLNGNIVFPFVYSRPLWFRDGICITAINERCGIIDKNGNIIVPFEYSSILRSRNQSFYFVISDTSDYLWGLIKLNEKESNGQVDYQIIVQCTYNRIDCLSSLFLITKGNKHGIINEMGETVLPCEYRYVDFLAGIEGNELFLVKKDKHVGVINNQGTTILPCEYDDIIRFKENSGHSSDIDASPSEDWIRTCKGAFFGCLSITGEVILPCEYEYISCDYSRGIITLERYQKTARYYLKDKRFVGNFVWDLDDAFPYLEICYIQPQGSLLLIDDAQPNTTEYNLDYTEAVECFQKAKKIFIKRDHAKKRLKIYFIIYLTIVSVAYVVFAIYYFWSWCLFFLITGLFYAIGSKVCQIIVTTILNRVLKYEVSEGMKLYLVRLAKWAYDWRLITGESDYIKKHINQLARKEK